MPETGPLSHLRVLDLTTELGTLGVRLLRGLGAQVTRIVPLEGDPLRQKAPFATADDGATVSLYAAHMLAGREELRLDLASDSGNAAFRALLGEADIVLESQPHGSLAALRCDYSDLATDFPHVIWTSITPFGRTGPRADWLATDLIGVASGGLMSLCGDPDRAPLRPSVEQGYAHAGIQAVVGTLAALHARNANGRGQLVDVSMQEAIANCLGNARLFYEFDGTMTRRAGGARAYGDTGSRLVYRCADGYIAFSRLPSSMQLVHDWIVEDGGTPGFDSAEWALLPQSGPGTPTAAKARELEESLDWLFARHGKMSLYEEGQRRGLLICPVSTPADLFENRQLIHREFFRDLPIEGLARTAKTPGPPFRSTLTAWDAPPSSERDAVPPAGPPIGSRDILKGVRVADFSWVGVGPLSTQQLAWMGADVIRVESTVRLDVFRSGGPKRGADPDASAYFANCNRDKQAIMLNLKNPKAREAALKLIAASDIVIESFTPGFMAEVGLSYEDVRSVNPNVIMLSASMEGGNGPHAQFRGFGLTLQATVGFTHFTGWPGRAPTGTGVAYTDWVATGLSATALLSALEHRRRTGEGQYIDLSQLEACTWALDAEILDYSVNGLIAEARGNRHREMAPHGAFPALGHDNWIAIAVRDDVDWLSLRVVAAADGVSLPEYASLVERLEHEDAIEQALSAWTSRFDKHALAERLQAAGIPAAAVADVADVHADVQLRHRGHFWRVRHEAIGEADWDGPAYRLSETPMYPLRPSPLLGQDNERVFTGLLGYSDAEFAELLAGGALD